MLTDQYQQKRFLVVDDFENFRNSLKKMLFDLGGQYVDTAANGNQALKRCEQVAYDILLVDYNLGDGKNGQQLLEQLRLTKLLKHTSIFIMVTAEVDKEVVISTMEYQPEAYLAKPFTLGVLKHRLDKALRRNESLHDILSALNEDNYASAIAHCDELMRNGSRYSSWCLKTKADLLYQLEHLDEAKSIYQQAARERQPDWALLGLGKTLAKQKYYPEALRTLTTLVQNNPVALEGYDWIAKIHQEMDDYVSAQKALAKAVSISPRSPLRQQALAEVCWRNNDWDMAIEAYGRTVDLSRHSIHYGPNNSLDLARCLTSYVAVADEENIERLKQDSLHAISKITKEFKGNSEVRMQSKLIETRLYAAVRDEKKTKEMINTVEAMCDKSDARRAPETLLELARTYTFIDDKEKAEEVIARLTEEYAHDPLIAKQIDTLVETPVSQEGKDKVAQFNKIGIQHYKNDEFIVAIKKFSTALQLYPKNIVLNLNLAQALLSQLTGNTNNQEYWDRCQLCFMQVEHISETHEQYGRYIQAKKIHDSLKQPSLN